MADMTQVYDALRKADAAGDTAGAQKLAAYIRTQNAAPVQEAPAASASPDTSNSTALDWAKGVGQAGLALGSGALKGLNTAVNDLLPGDSQGLQQQINADPVMNYQPTNPAGQAILGGIGKIAAPITSVLGAAKNAIANTAGQRTADVVGDLATLVGARGALSKVGEAAPIAKAATSAVPTEVKAATDAGFKLTPDQAGGSPLGSAIQSLSGSAKLERSVSKQNVKVANNLAAQDIGISGPLTPANIAAAKVPANAVYNQVSKLGQIPTDSQFANDIAGVSNRTGSGSFGFDVPAGVDRLKAGYGSVQEFDAGDAVSKVRQLRSDASKNIKAPNDPEKNALGYAQKQVAEAIENQLERHIQSRAGTGISPDLITQLRQARVQLAKIHSVEDAMDGSNISPKSLAKQQDRGVPLSGNLKTIANAASNFDRSFQDVSKIRDGGPFGVLDLGYGAAAGLAHPLALSAVLARPVARAALASGPYQRTLSTPLRVPQGGLLGLQGSPLLLTGQQQQQQGLLGPQ